MSSVVEDKSFHVPVEPAATALRTAKKVVNWASTNEEAFLSFEGLVCLSLCPCLSDQRASKSSSEDMWRDFWVRTSEVFRVSWCNFWPAKWGWLPSLLFTRQSLITSSRTCYSYKLQQTSPNSNQFSRLQLQPVHVVRYAAEYVCRKVYKEISGSTQPNKEELLQAIMNLVDMNRGQAEEVTLAAYTYVRQKYIRMYCTYIETKVWTWPVWLLEMVSASFSWCVISHIQAVKKTIHHFNKVSCFWCFLSSCYSESLRNCTAQHLQTEQYSYTLCTCRTDCVIIDIMPLQGILPIVWYTYLGCQIHPHLGETCQVDMFPLTVFVLQFWVFHHSITLPSETRQLACWTMYMNEDEGICYWYVYIHYTDSTQCTHSCLCLSHAPSWVGEGDQPSRRLSRIPLTNLC